MISAIQRKTFPSSGEISPANIRFKTVDPFPSTLSSYQKENKKEDTFCDKIKWLANLIWYYLSFQWVKSCMKPKKEETTLETTDKTEATTALEKTVAVTTRAKTKQKTPPPPHLRRVPSIDGRALPLEKDQQILKEFLQSFPKASERLSALDRISEKLLLQAQVNFENALYKCSNCEQDATKEIQQAANEVEQSITEMMKVIAFCESLCPLVANSQPSGNPQMVDIIRNRANRIVSVNSHATLKQIVQTFLKFMKGKDESWDPIRKTLLSLELREAVYAKLTE